jgi:hypothetical protein
MDKHHPAGANNHPATIDVAVNDHRAVLSVAQYDWPEETLQNPRRSPVLMIAACIRGFIDTLTYLLDEFLARIPEALEELDKLLAQHMSPDWWVGTIFETFIKEWFHD